MTNNSSSRNENDGSEEKPKRKKQKKEAKYVDTDGEYSDIDDKVFQLIFQVFN